MKNALNAVCVAAVVAFAAAGGFGQEFIPIPPLDGDTTVQVTGVSADGSVVVGTSGGTFSWRAFIWTKDGGTVELDPIGPAGTWSRAFGVSADGSTVIGQSNPGGTSCGDSVRWVNAGPPELLNFDPDASGFGCSAAVSVSGDGNMAVGEGDWSGPFGLQLMAFRWNPDKGMVALGGLDPFDIEVIATAVSADGTTVLGLSENGTPQGFKWTEAGGHQGLGYLPGFGSFSVGIALSDDGSIIGGQADIGSGGWASAYWTEQTGWIEIPSLLASAFVGNAVQGMTADGSVMVGLNTGTNPAGRTLFIWDEEKGARHLQTALEEEFNIDLMGWQLADFDPPHNNAGNVAGISGSGNAIIGNTLHPDSFENWGWIAYLESTTIPGDLTGSGNVGVPDLLILLGAWGPCADCGNCPADLTGDCTVGVADLLILLANWG